MQLLDLFGQQSQAPLAEQIQQLQRERDDATNRLASMADEIAKIKSNNLELFKLRGMVGMLKTQVASSEKQLAQKAEALSAGLPHSAWQLREHRKIGEFQNVGNETPEATAETILWAAQSQATNLINMIHLPTALLTKAHDEGMTDVLIMQLATKLMFEVRVVAKDEQQQVWLDGGDVTTFNEQTKDGTNTYTGVIDFHLERFHKLCSVTGV